MLTRIEIEQFLIEINNNACIWGVEWPKNSTMTIIYYWTIPLHSFIAKTIEGMNQFNRIATRECHFQHTYRRVVHSKIQLDGGQSCLVFGLGSCRAEQLPRSGDWRTIIDSKFLKTWVNNKMHSTGLCVLLNNTRTFVRGFFLLKAQRRFKASLSFLWSRSLGTKGT